MSKFDALVDAIATAIGWENVISKRLRKDEAPPSAAWHLFLDGRAEYVLTLTPTNLEPEDEAVRKADDQRARGGAATK